MAGGTVRSWSIFFPVLRAPVDPASTGEMPSTEGHAAAVAGRTTVRSASTPPRGHASNVPSTDVGLGSSSAHIPGERSRLTPLPFPPAYTRQDRISPDHPLPCLIRAHPPTSVVICRTKFTRL